MEELNMPASDNPEEPTGMSLNLSAEAFKKKNRKWPFIVTAGIAVLAVAVALLWTPIINLIQGKNAKTLQDLEQEVLTAVINKLVDSYDFLAVSKDSEPAGLNVHLEFDIDELALLLIEKEYPNFEFLEVLNDVALDAAYENDGDKFRLTVSPVHETAELPEGKIVLDAENEVLYIAAQSLSEQYLEFDLAEFSDLAKYLPILAQLPKAERLESILKAYMDGFLGLMTVKEVRSETVSADDVQQKCTAYAAEIIYKDFLRLTIDALEELSALYENDSELAGVFVNAQTELDAALKEASDNVMILWTVYTDDQERIIGRDIRLSTGGEGVNYLCVRNEDDLALKLTAFDLEFTGTASCKNDELNGTFILYIDGVKYLELKPDDVDLKKLENGEIMGTVKFTPSAELLGADLGLPLSMDVDFDVSQEACRIIVNYMDLAAVSISLTEYVPEKISLPQGTAIDGSDTDALNRWLKSMDLENLKSLLSDLGLSE